MSVDLSAKTTRTLYQSRFCKQENFDIIISGSTDVFEYSEERVSFRISSNDFDKIEQIYKSKRHSFSDRTICERSNVWTVCSKLPITGKNQIRPS